jgi:beta-lactamase regulating signal transducer with metallopeptidase domain/type II secretory pathway component GspD/PulD (secretin)
MNTLLNWLTSPEWALVVKALLHSLWQGALIATGLALLLRSVHGPTLRYRLTLGGLATVVTSAIITWAVLNAPKAAPSEFAALPPQTIAPMPAPTGPVQKIAVLADRKPAHPQVQWTAWIALAWLVGAGVMLGRASAKIAGAEQLRRSCHPLENDRIAALVAEARNAVMLTRQIRVAVTDRLTSPAVVGVLVPTLILPLSLITTLTPEQIRFVLLHELAHIRRGDYLANLFQLFAEALLFFNPAVWWLSHQIRREREACCDALAIDLSGAPADYARTLVSVAETMLNPSPAAAPAFGNGREPSALSDRVQRALVPGYRPSLHLTWKAMIGALVAGAILLTGLAVGTRETVAATAALISPEKKISESANTVPIDRSSSKEDAAQTEASSETAPTREVVFRFKHEPNINPAGTVVVTIPNADDPKTAATRELRSLQDGEVRVQVPIGRRTSIEPAETIGFWFAKRMEGYLVTNGPGPMIWELPIVPAGILRVRAQNQDGSFARDVQLSVLDQCQQPLLPFSSPGSYQGVWATGLEPVPFVIPEGGPYLITGRRGDEFWVSKPVVLKEAGRSLDVDLKFSSTATTNSQALDLPALETADRSAVIAHAMPNLPRPTARNGAQYNSPIGLPVGETNLHTRIFKVTAIELNRLMGDVGPVMSTNKAESVQRFMTRIGFNPQLPGRAMFHSTSGGGRLFVHGTAEEISRVEKALAGQPISTQPVAATAVPMPEPSPWIIGASQPGPSRGYKMEGLTVSVLEDGRYWYRSANLDLEGFRARLEEWTNVVRWNNHVLNERFNVLVHTNAPAQSISNAVRLIQEFGATANIEPLTPKLATTSAPARQGATTTPSPQVSKPTDTNLHTRIFRVDPKIFATAMTLPGSGPTNARLDVALVQDATRKFFNKLGVDLQPPKAVFFNDRHGTLFIHARSADMDVIEKVIADLPAPPQVHIQAKLVEVPMDVDVDGTIFNSLKFARTNFVSHPQVGDKSSLTSNLLTGFLTPRQAEGMLKTFETRKGVNIITMPDVTTVSGRQAQLQFVDTQTIVTGAVHRTRGFSNPSPLPFGPTLDVIPYVGSDGYTVQMSIFPTVVEFLGHDDTAPGYQWSVDRPVKPLSPLPRFRVRQVPTTGVAAYDGKTIVMIGFVTETLTRQTNGSETRQRDPQAQKKQLLIFVTPTLIDSAGNRIHSDEELSRLPNTAPKLQNPAPSLPPIPPGIPVDDNHMRDMP